MFPNTWTRKRRTLSIYTIISWNANTTWPPNIGMIDSRLLPLLKNRETKTAEYLAQVSEEFYGWGVSCLSLMDWLEVNRDGWTPQQYANAVLCFHRIKTEFRCEKMLMFYMLDFVFFSNFTLPNG